jgi:hypothetical protein
MQRRHSAFQKVCRFGFQQKRVQGAANRSALQILVMILGQVGGYRSAITFGTLK